MRIVVQNVSSCRCQISGYSGIEVVKFHCEETLSLVEKLFRKAMIRGLLRTGGPSEETLIVVKRVKSERIMKLRPGCVK